MSINLEVSIGEALDKLTILDIKRNKISDKRINDINKEYYYLFEKLSYYVYNYPYHYKILKSVNLNIWELQDMLRDKTLDKMNFYTLYDKLFNLNDSRFLIKKKINNLSNSSFKEQKGYKSMALAIYLNFNKEYLDVDKLNGAIRYFSFHYEKLNIYTNDDNYEYINNKFSNDSDITIHNPKKININELDSGFLLMDYIYIGNYQIKKNISHPFFNNDKYFLDENVSDEKCCIYKSLNLNPSIYEEYYY